MSSRVTLILMVPLIVVLGCAPAPVPVLEVDPTFFALGALYEYIAYWADRPGDEIDTFGAARTNQAIVFARQLERVAEERNLDTDILVREVAGGCMEVSSRPMRDYLTSRYPNPSPTHEAMPDGLPPSEPTRKLLRSSREMLDGRESKLSYLAGAHLRFATGGRLYFANSGHKARLVQDLLIEMACRDVEVSSTPRGHYPTVFTVSYVPSPEIEALFQQVDAEVLAVKRDRDNAAKIGR